MTTFYPTGGTQYYLAASIGSTDDTILLSSFLEPISNTPYTMALMNSSIAYATIAPISANSEFISFTGITQNADGTATLTGVTRGLSRSYPYTSSSTYKLPHAGQSIFILSDAPQVFNEYAALKNNNAFTGANTVPTPSNSGEIANKGYVDGVVASGAGDASTVAKGVTRLTTSPNVVLGTFTVTIASPAVFTLSNHGLTADDTVSFTTTGTLPTGLSVGVDYYVLSTGLTTNTFEVSATLGGTAINTSGTQSGIHTATKTTPIAVSPTDPRLPTQDENDALAGNGGTPSGTNKYVTQLGVLLEYLGDGSDGDVTISTPTTLTRDMYYNNLTVNSTLNTNGWRIFVKGTINGSGTIANNGANGSAGADAGGAGGAGGASNSGYFPNMAGASGGKGSGNGPADAGGSTPNTASLIDITASQAAGAGGNGGGTGGNSGTRTKYLTRFFNFLWQITGGLDITTSGSTAKLVASMSGPGGGGGRGSSTGNGGSGGGGGAGGGIVFIAAQIWAGTFTIQAKGGNGGNGGNGNYGPAGGGGGGSGGNGGTAIVLYGQKTWTGSYQFNGGSAGIGGIGYGGSSNGSNGSAGTTTSVYFEVDALNI